MRYAHCKGDLHLIKRLSSYIGRKYGTEVLKSKLSDFSKIVTVVDLQTDLVLSALKTDWTDYEDSLQYSTAIQKGAGCIVTRNKKDFEKL